MAIEQGDVILLSVHVYGRTASGNASESLFTGDGPRFGLIVGKGVEYGAVVRHAVLRVSSGMSATR